MTSRALHRAALAAALITGAAVLATVPVATAKPQPQSTVPVRLLALNDFHGNLEPPSGSGGRITNEAGVTVEAGGAVYVATYMKSLRDANTLEVAQGDLIGATPLISAAYHDEPTIEFMNDLGIDTSAVGNHEFDEGYAELRRITEGGCHPVDGCSPAGPWQGADFEFLGANVLFKDPSASPVIGDAPGPVVSAFSDLGVPALPPISVKKINGQKIGFIGIVTKTTPTIVTTAGIVDLKFVDEVAAAQRASKVLTRLGVDAQVVLVHEGDQVTPGQSPDACSAQPGVGTAIAQQVDPAVDMILSGHSHQAYLCTVTDPAGNPRLYSQGGSFGKVITQVDFRIDTRTHDVVRSSVAADNHVVLRTVTPDPDTAAFLQTWRERVAPVANAPVGTITATISTTAAPSGETPMGLAIADAQLAAMDDVAGAEIALMNPGGVRSSLTFASSPANEGDGVVTYGEAFTVQPFNNFMQTVTVTGAALELILEQQFPGGPNNQPFTKILQPSAGFTYAYSSSAPWGSKVSDMRINDVPVTDTQTIRVAANNFLIGGGDSFFAFTQGTDMVSGPLDIDAFVAYLGANSPVAPPATTRITRLP
ncbi:MAG TPA: bifunctional metallophosphatase/5'-nucleotidase [Nocardioides sp.]|nr:bifunctional metallophosphatase/5'-nucleotidase [Nocardioides sp.]